MLLAALAGLFAMHGMSDHGTMHDGVTETHGLAAAGSHAAMTAETAAGWVDLDAVASSSVGAVRVAVEIAIPSASAGDAVGGGAHAAMSLCLAILAGAAVLALRRLRTWSHPLRLAVVVASQRRFPVRARAPDPPDLYVLSIQRC